MVNHPQYICHENFMNCVEEPKYMAPKDESSRSEGVQYTTGEEWRRTTKSPRKNEATGPKQKQHSVVDVSCDESKVQCFR